MCPGVFQASIDVEVDVEGVAIQKDAKLNVSSVNIPDVDVVFVCRLVELHAVPRLGGTPGFCMGFHLLAGVEAVAWVEVDAPFLSD